MISQEVCQTEDKAEEPKKTFKLRYKAEQCQTCGSKIVRVNRSRHRRSRKHKDAEYLWHEMLETR